MSARLRVESQVDARLVVFYSLQETPIKTTASDARAMTDSSGSVSARNGGHQQSDNVICARSDGTMTLSG